MLADPNDESPANLDASVSYRTGKLVCLLPNKVLVLNVVKLVFTTYDTQNDDI